MVIPTSYIYELVRKEDNKVFYIGKSTNPRSRFLNHVGYIGKNIEMRILDKYFDKEHEYIIAYLNRGVLLENKNSKFNTERDYKIGDIITLKDGR